MSGDGISSDASRETSSALQRLWRHPALWALLAAVLGLIVMAAQVQRGGGNLTALVCFGEDLELALWQDPRVPEGTVVQRGAQGYDGQFYYVLALAPFRTDTTVPPERRQRIFYPFLAWMIGFGRPEVTATAMALVNLIALALGTGLAARWLTARGLSPAFSLLAGASAGSLMACQYDCPDAVLVALLAAALWAIDVRRWPLASLAFAAACLTKESALAAWLAVAIGVAVVRPGRGAWTIALAPLPWLLWIWSLSSQAETFVLRWSLNETLSTPFAGWWNALTGPATDASGLAHAIGPFGLALLLAAAVVVALQARGGPHQLLAGVVLIWAVSALGWKREIWDHFVAAARNMAPVTLFALLLAAVPGRRLRFAAALLALAVMALALLRAVALGSAPEVFLTEYTG